MVQLIPQSHGIDLNLNEKNIVTYVIYLNQYCNLNYDNIRYIN